MRTDIVTLRNAVVIEQRDLRQQLAEPVTQRRGDDFTVEINHPKMPEFRLQIQIGRVENLL